MADTQLKVISTVDARLSELSIKNGQMIFVKDTHSLYLDMGNIRTQYHDITILQTESIRKELLAPTAGFYFCLSSDVLWYYQEKWIQITNQPTAQVVTRDSYLNFPSIGSESVIYVDKTANKSYRWDDNDLKYYVIGSDYNDIELIDAGDSN